MSNNYAWLNQKLVVIDVSWYQMLNKTLYIVLIILMNNILLVKCVHIKKIYKCRCYQCLCTGDGSLLNVKLSDLKKKVYINILLLTGTLRSSLNTKNVFFEYIKKTKWCGFYSLFILLCMA